MFKVTCPYCFNKYSKRRSVYLCPNDGQCFERPHSFRRRIRKPSCGSDTRICCPVCGAIIPPGAIDVPLSSIVVVGAGQSEKTEYLNVALHELRNKARFLAVSPLLEETARWFDKLYFNKQLLEANQPVWQPLIWSVINIRRKKGKPLSKHTLTILDVCGDMMHADDTLSFVSEYLKNCSSILFVVDPLILNGVKKADLINDDDAAASLTDLYYSDLYHENIADKIDAIAHALREVCGIKNHKKLEIPFALVLAKMDLISAFSK